MKSQTQEDNVTMNIQASLKIFAKMQQSVYHSTHSCVNKNY